MPRHSWRFSLALLAVVFVAEAPASQTVAWRNDLEAAKLEARNTNRLVLVHYWATWCPACLRMQREVFVDPAVAAAISGRFVPVKLNFDQYQVDARAMGVTILPTDVVISPGGQVMGSLSGFADSREYVARLNAVDANSRPRTQGEVPQAPFQPASQLNRPTYAGPAAGAANEQSISAGQPSASSQNNDTGRPGPAGTPADYLGDRYADYRGSRLLPTNAAPPYAVAAPLNGQAANSQAATQDNDRQPISPVSASGTSLPGHYSPTPVLSSRQQPQQRLQAAQSQQHEAVPQQAAIVQQRPRDEPPTLSQRQKRQTLSIAAAQQPANPATGPSPPQFGLDGFCPVTLIEKKAWKFGDRRWGAVHHGVTYLFCGLEEQQKFLRTPDRYSPVHGGSDIVILLHDNGRIVPGQRSHGVTYAGRIYLFSSQETLDAFTKQPRRYVDGYSKLMQASRPQYATGLR